MTPSAAGMIATMDKDEALKLLKGGPAGIQEWNKRRDDGEEIPDLWGVDLRGANLHGVNLSEAQLTGARLEKAGLIGANLKAANLSSAYLEGTIFIKAHLENVILADAHLEGAILADAHLEGAILQVAHLEGARLGGAHLEGANLFLAQLAGAALDSAHLEGADLYGADLSNANVAGVTYDRRRGRFQGIRVATCYGNAIFKRDAQDQDYIETRYARIRADEVSLPHRINDLHEQDEGERPGPHDNPSWEWTKKRLRLWQLTYCEPVRLAYHKTIMWLWARLDYGRSIWRVAVIASAVAALFGLVYSLSPGMLYYDEGRMDVNRFTPFYYSIVTYTTLGFGDVTPKTLAGQILVTFEVILGYVTLGLLISILANRVARRS